MERGDVVVSPPWTYHEHYNGGPEPVIFVDGYDNGYNPNVNVSEKLPNSKLHQDITKPEGYTQSVLGHVRARGITTLGVDGAGPTRQSPIGRARKGPPEGAFGKSSSSRYL